jgi:hypothetical protein
MPAAIKTTRKPAAPSLPDDDAAADFDLSQDGVEILGGADAVNNIPADASPVPAAVAAVAVAPKPRKPSLGERVASVLGFVNRNSRPVSLPALPAFDLTAAIHKAPDFPELAAAVKRWREIRAPLVDLTPARVRERVAEVRDMTRFDPTTDATKAAELVVVLEKKLTEENALREGQMQTQFRAVIAPRLVAVVQAALVPAREALAAAEKIDQTLADEYGVQAAVAARYRSAVVQLQGVAEDLTGEAGNFNLSSPQGRFYLGQHLPELAEAVCPAYE